MECTFHRFLFAVRHKMILDTRTLVLVAFGMAITAAVTFAASWRFNRDIQALRFWVWTYLLNALGLLLIVLNPTGQVSWLLLGSNMAFCTAALMLLWGSRNFLGRPRPSILFMAAPALAILAMAYFIFADFDYRARVLISAFYLGLMAMATAYEHFRPGAARGSAPVKVMGVLQLIHGTSQWTRFLVVAVWGAGDNLLDVNAIQTAVFFEACLMIVAVPIACLLMATERLHENLRRMAMNDDLTGLLNRRAFMDEARRHFARALRQGSPLSVLMIDLDHFKKINDARGHDAGDAVLAAFADELRAGLRRSDLPCRYGGEEFCVLLPDTGMDGAAALAENLRRRFAAVEVPFDGAMLSATISIGVAEAQPAMHMIEEAISQADRALYAAKRGGRDCVIRFEASEDGAAPSLSYRSRPVPAARSAAS